nr:hypothetical protein [Tanacetum cinerariifolium]
FKLDIDYSSLVNSEFKSRTNSWIRYDIHRNVEEVYLWLFDVGIGQDFTFEDELFFNTSCITRMTLSFCGFNPPNGAISWERLERIDVTSKSVKKLVLFEYYRGVESEEDIIDCIKINAPYISSLTIKGELFLRELVLLNVSSLVEVDLKYSITYKEFVIFAEEIFRGLLKSLGHVENITFGDHCSELLSRLKGVSDTSNDDRADQWRSRGTNCFE